MIYVGVDIEDVSRFEDKPEAFLNRIYTKKELSYCFQNKFASLHLAVRYCAKEAVVKAICSAGLKPLSYNKIEITNNEVGVPLVNILDSKFKDYVFSISLSHEKQKAIAFVIMQEVKEK